MYTQYSHIINHDKSHQKLTLIIFNRIQFFNIDDNLNNQLENQYLIIKITNNNAKINFQIKHITTFLKFIKIFYERQNKLFILNQFLFNDEQIKSINISISIINLTF